QLVEVAANPASASLFSTAAAIAETLGIRTGSISPPGAAAGIVAGMVAGMVPKVRNISASSEIAASSGLNATGSATHLGPDAAICAASSASNWPTAIRVPCDGAVEISA